MSEFRCDPITGRQVIIAPQRSRRPIAAFSGSESKREPGPAYEAGCPFCAGNEAMTPPELLALGSGGVSADERGWQVRVVPNRYPAVERTQERPRANDSASAGYGAHEVLVESPLHNRQPGSFPPGQMELVIEALHRRGEALAGDPKLHYLQFFRNYRSGAGASLEHPHSQIIALPFVPPLLRRELEQTRKLYLAGGGCPFCRLLEEECVLMERIIALNESFSAFIPYAARSPFESWILPRRHGASFLGTGAEERAALAAILERVLRALAQALDDPPYNYYLHAAPLRSPPLPYYHWHIEIHPRVGINAGFEMGSGVYINEIVPEEAARFIREKGRDEDGRERQQDLLHPCAAQSPAGGES